MYEILKSKNLFEEAQKYIPGGVNSPARACISVDETPRFIKRADKQFIYDVDNNRYTDYIGSWGPMILGNNSPVILNAVKEKMEEGLSFGAPTEVEVQMAELLCHIIPSFEKVRMVNSGTEATMSAIRTARGYTGREKVIKFIGCYHGHHDALLVKAGSGLIKKDCDPDSAGVTKGAAKDTLLATYNDLESVKQLFDQYDGEIAAVIVEPVAANMGVVLPDPEFLVGLRELCTKKGTVLIFDEVITGFRMALGGAQELFGITPDMSTFGKIIGGGMPVGAYGGKAEIMRMVAPDGPVYQAGTLSGNPVAMAAGLAQINYLKDNPEVYNHINAMGDRLFNGMKKILVESGRDLKVNHLGSIGSIFFTNEPVTDFESALKSDLDWFKDYYKFMISHGQYIAPAQFEAMFISYAHSEEDIDNTLEVIGQYFEK